MRLYLILPTLILALLLPVSAQTAPSVTLQPVEVAVIKGAPVSLVAAGTGDPAPSWQWYRNGAAIPGATSPTLSIAASTLPDHGNYFARLTNASGSVDTSTVAVSVLYPRDGLRHRYSFSGNLNDSIGTAHATAMNGAAAGGSSIAFTQGSSHYLRLPATGSGTTGLNLNTYTQLTVEFWCSMAEHNNKLKLFEFGDGTLNTSSTNYLYFAPRTTNTGSALAQVGFSDNGTSSERIASRSPRMTNVTNVHIVCVFDPVTNTETIYLNGAVAATSSSFSSGTLPPLSALGTDHALIGRSIFPSTTTGSGSNWAHLNGSIDEFRIYRVALRPQDVTANFAAGPGTLPALPNAISFSSSPQSVTVTDPETATFGVDVNGPKPLAVQWYKNGSLIPGATATTYTTSTVPADSGSTYFCRATSGVLTLDSSNATLTVNTDNVRPVISGLVNSGANSVLVRFSEPVTSVTATTLANYSLSPSISLSNAVLGGDSRTVTLTTATPLAYGSIYSLTVSGVADTSFAGNLILPGTIRGFTAVPLVLGSIGTPTVAPAADSSASGAYILRSSGSQPRASADQYGFSSESLTGDFDVRVRVASLGLADLWSQAGLMARNGTGPGDLLAAAVATPGTAGCFFMARTSINSAPDLSGSYPVNFPHTWLRLRREGNVFTGFASLDGTAWTLLSSATVAMSGAVQVGVFTSSGTSGETTAAFSEYGQASGAVVATQPLPFEPDGPSSRRSPITITEISYNPNSVNGSGNQEFIEIHNTAGWAEDLSGWTLKGGIDYSFPGGTSIPAGGYLVVAAVPAAVQATTGLTGVLGPWSGALSNSGEDFRLENEVGGTIAEVEYADLAPWPVQADGLGHTLVLVRPSYGENDARAWAASDALGGSPGRRDPWSSSPVRNLRINEFLANSATPLTDFVELFNTSTQPVDIGGCRIGNGTSLSGGYLLPSPTVIPARGYLALTESQLGFALAPDGGRLWLLQPGVRLVDAIAYGGQDVNVSRDHDFRELASPTQGTANSPPGERPVVINEIMYNPLSGNQDEEYVELYNRSSGAVDVSGWRVGGGIDFTIPAGTSIAAGGYLVIARNQTVLLAKGYAALSAANVAGNFTGSLSNGGETITLSLPISGSAAYATVDEVTYRTGGQWGSWTDGGGSSLELRDARADNSLAVNWGDSDESAKAGWTTLTVNMPHDYRMPDPDSGTNHSMANRVEFFLQGAGKCLVDDIAILDPANLNYVTNGGFESGLGGGLFAWTGQGDQEQISLFSGGAASGSNCLQLVASDRGDTGANRVRNALSIDGTNVSVLPANTLFTVRAKVRWMAGSRYFHLRSRGNGLELPGVLDIPSTPGTPGAANSISGNAGPAIAEASSWPILPAAGEAVVVTTRLPDPDGILGASVLYRVDPATSFTSLIMNDAGTGGDSFAGDGVWSATIPGQASGELVAWKIQVTDAAGSPAVSVYPAPDPLIFPTSLQSRECYVRFGETLQPGNLGTYRLWLTAATIAEWNTREKNSNQPLPGTFVLGNHRVYQGIRTLYSGSPWHTGSFSGPTGTGGGGSQCDYEVNFSDDDLFLGTDDLVIQNSTGSCQDEFVAFWIARKLGLFAPNRRPVNLFVNGSRKGTVFEDAEQPSGASIEQYQRSASEGTLFKVEDWFEFDDAGGSFNFFNANLPQTSTTVNGVGNQKKTARYRWNWRVRSQDDPNTYQPIHSLVDLMTAPIDAGFVPNLEAQVDLHSWLGSIMAHHIVGNRDTYGYERGKNAYAYKAVNDRWKAYVYDMDFSLAAAQDSATSNLFIANPSATASKDGQPETAKLFGIPGTKRICWNVLQEAAAGPLSGIASPMIDQRFADFKANGVNASAPTATKQYIADRRAYILSQIPSGSFGVTSTAASGSNLSVTGTAPVGVSEVVVNGVEWAVTWTSDTQWSLDYQMQPGLNTLNLTGTDRKGAVVATAPPVTATFNGSTNWPGIRINEWMSDNDSIVLDPADGAFDDWFEIYNPTAQVVDLAGWYLTDDPVQPGKFLVPSGFTIPAHGFIRIWADDSPVQTVPGQLHVNFGLSNGGDSIVLTAPDFTPIDSVNFGPQATDRSNGRYPDGATAMHDLTEPTPAGTNIAILWESMTYHGAGSEFRFTTTPGRTYRIHQSTDLVEWTPLGTDQTATGSTLTIIDSEALTLPNRFYRVELRP